jgi:cytoskeletal protein RodZ
MSTPGNPKRSGAFIATTKVLILAASLAATVGGWAAMSAPAVAATTTSTSTTASASTQTNSTSNSLVATLSQILSPVPSNVQYQPVIRSRSSR